MPGARSCRSWMTGRSLREPLGSVTKSKRASVRPSSSTSSRKKGEAGRSTPSWRGRVISLQADGLQRFAQDAVRLQQAVFFVVGQDRRHQLDTALFADHTGQ